ncbi:sterol desaturase family protein [Streptosporangium saharense]|uniref:sterol desaturase family protein n=1 Tax=Streptosporangium saharense TaxID=1706840 RepID=UPI00342F7D14
MSEQVSQRRQRLNVFTFSSRLLVRYCAYPVLLVAVVATAVVALRDHLDLGQVSALFLAGTIAYLAVLERVIPYERGWHPSRREWGWYGLYLVLTIATSSVAQLLVTSLVGVLAVRVPVIPLWAEIPTALLLGSLASYVVHRLAHTRPLLWRLHGVHHVPQKVNVANNGVNHVFDVLFEQGVVQLSLALVGFSQESVFVVGLFVVAQGYFVHTNADIRLGPLNYVFASPEQHRLHHSTDLSEAGHYGSDLSVWDLMFGSFTWRPGRTPVAIGLTDPASFPRTDAVLATFFHPWRRRPAAPSPEAGGPAA